MGKNYVKVMNKLGNMVPKALVRVYKDFTSSLHESYERLMNNFTTLLIYYSLQEV